MTTQLQAAIDRLDLDRLTFKDMIEIAAQHSVKTSTIAAMIEHRRPLTA